MSYQVLARKWRPRSFPQMVGQEHVLRALINALDNDRLHHAFLFTGTRGVGKTSVARILAKSINCERGMSSSPCGECSACREIDEGRFVDLIEVDAASRTKVEDTRELLENVQYAPSRGRYKVYLIDEVHMLSGHSFNALLKTLEEPPPHVKFLLATTDPKKLPVTILSRCLQFNLKRLPLELIRDHLTHILTEEGVETETGALAELARAADGSMRDALSLLDQAIAYGGGRVGLAEVQEMLGTIDRNRVTRLLHALAEGDAERLLAGVAELAEQSPDFAGVLEALNALLHRLALTQQVPAAVDDSLGDREALLELATQLTPEQVQLYYQIGIIGRRDLPLAPEPRSGFEMVLLRMLAFRPTASRDAVPPPPSAHAPQPQATVREPSPAEPAAHAASPEAEPVAAPVAEPQPPAAVAEPSSAPHTAVTSEVQDEAGPLASPTPLDGAGAWAELVAKLPLTGMTRQLAEHTALRSHTGERVELTMDPGFENLYNPKWEQGLAQALEMYYGHAIKLTIQSGEVQPAGATPQQLRQEQEVERQQQAEQSISNDPTLQAILEHFDGEVEPGSVRPTE
ncbi:MAG: DNA polymerase III subunit gamma/tau [Gammaproteobacteria bacterium]|nr:DNA polymerase III subunit gamma/tau [Gammaproteobacteria bacterium]MCW8841657.1 DNA polymerase III subunit gamma/tau [Gammaproteobacteria bacterium]MCW8957432.1 DNA polymerase III subunit gamma/tau [Gammaproteobacteria bacterium]MCW8974037.1 DNA polymerase III subunit gamma/tau [Gammaproteobacteria bacterium]MCW8993688.1 DNA polymerase III subunit gamma/tau [Gammaproteobacteria bacterium]